MRAILGPVLIIACVVVAWGLWRGAPSGISDARYSEFKTLAAPRLLYSCKMTPTRNSFLPEERKCLKTGRSNCDAKIDDLVKAGTKMDVDFLGGSRFSTYDQVLSEARHACNKTVGNTGTIEFVILEAEET